MSNPEQWLAGFGARISCVASATTEAQDDIASASATVASPDGAVEVTVGPNGGLQGLALRPRACELTPGRLADTILDTARKTQQEVLTAFEPLCAGTETMCINVTEDNKYRGTLEIEAFHSLIQWIDDDAESESEEVVDISFTAVGAAASTAHFAVDPLGSLVGMGRLIEHISFLREPLDQLMDNPEAATRAPTRQGSCHEMA